MKAHCGPCSDPDFNHECQNHLFIKMLLCKPPKGIAFDTKPISSKCFFFFDRRCHNTKILFLLSWTLQGVTEEHQHWDTFLHLDTKHHLWWVAFSVTISFFCSWLVVLYAKMISFIGRGRKIIKVKLTEDFSSNGPYGLERKVLLFSFVFQSRCAGSYTFGFRDTVISPSAISAIITKACIVLF